MTASFINVATCAVGALAIAWLLLDRLRDTDWAARRRWAATNRRVDRERRCGCGQPGVIRVESLWPARGGAVPIFWCCEKHADRASGTTRPRPARPRRP